MYFCYNFEYSDAENRFWGGIWYNLRKGGRRGLFAEKQERGRIMKNTTKVPLPADEDAEILELLKKTSEQYRVYKELNDVANIVRKPVFPCKRIRVPGPTLTSGAFAAKGK